MSGKLTKAVLKRIGRAALSGMTDAEVEADPVAAMNLAQSAMRGAVQAKSMEGGGL